MKKMTGGEAVVESLIENGVDTVFGLPGAQLDPIFAALYDRQDKIKVIHPRHEQGCAYMAYGYAEVTGEIGTMLVVPGPGLLNAGAGMVTGYACNSKMLCLVGQGRAHLAGKGFGVLHEIPNQLETARGLVKWAGKVEHASEIPGKMVDAIDQINDHRPRPVYLELPFDISKEEATIPEIAVASKTHVTPPLDADHIAAAAEALANAKCPLIIAGGGAIDAGPEIQALAERLNIPVAMTQNGLGTLDCRHPLAFTQIGGHKWWSRADVVLAIGTRLFPSLVSWGRDRDLKIFKADIDPTELRRLPPPINSVHGDAAEVASEIENTLASLAPAEAPDRRDLIAEVRAEVEVALADIAPQRELLAVIRDVLGEHGILVSDLTQLYFAAQDAYPVYKPRTYIHPSYQGTLGHCVSTAIGAQVAAGERPVIGLAGDGGFMFTLQDLATAVQHNIPATFLVMNNKCYGNVKRILENDYQGRVLAADLQNPDLMKLADSFGMPGHHAGTPEELREALTQAINHAGPVLVEYDSPDFPSPWPLHFAPKVRG